MKKIITLLLALSVLLCLFGCGKGGNVSESGKETGTKTTDEAFFGENYVDEASGYTLKVERSVLNPDEYSFRVYHITDDNKQESVWTFTGKYEGKDTVSYTDGEKTVRNYNDDGSESVDEQYSDGTGSVTKNGDTVTWKDDKEDAGKDFVFKISD